MGTISLGSGWIRIISREVSVDFQELLTPFNWLESGLWPADCLPKDLVFSLTASTKCLTRATSRRRHFDLGS